MTRSNEHLPYGNGAGLYHLTSGKRDAAGGSTGCRYDCPGPEIDCGTLSKRDCLRIIIAAEYEFIHNRRAVGGETDFKYRKQVGEFQIYHL